MKTLSDQRILVTGVAGQIAFPLASALARDNEVWGLARFSEPGSRERVGQAGIHAAAVDLAAPDWSELPRHFDYVLHLAAVIPPGHDYDATLRINAEGSGHLMRRFRDARAFLVMSTCGVYLPSLDPLRPVVESDPLGGSHQPYSPTYCVSKIAQEAVARFAASAYGLPTTIARMNAAYGDNGGLPAILLEMILAGQPVPVFAGRPPLMSPIHDDDILAHLPGLLEAAAVPATITNWGGDETVDMREMVQYLGELTGRKPMLVESPDGIQQILLDPTRRRALAGPCRVGWRDGLRRMVRARHPEVLVG